MAKRTSKCQVFSSTVPAKLFKNIPTFLNFFRLFLVSGKSHMKKGTLWEILTIHSFAQQKKMKGYPLEILKKFAKKSLTKLKNHAQKIFGQGRDSNPRSSAWQTSKKQLLCQVPVETVWHSFVLVQVSL